MSIILCTLSCFSTDIICTLSHKISQFKSCKRYEEKPQNCKHFGGGIIDFEQRRLFAFLFSIVSFSSVIHSSKCPIWLEWKWTILCNHLLYPVLFVIITSLIISFHHLIYLASFQRKYLIWLEWKWTILCSHLLRPPLSAVITSLIISFHHLIYFASLQRKFPIKWRRWANLLKFGLSFSEFY